MSSLIAIQRRSVSPADSNRTGIAVSFSSHSALYVPIHRTPSSPDSLPSHTSSSPLPSRVYSPNALFALQSPTMAPQFTSKMRARIHEACPDVLATARVRRISVFRMRKSLHPSPTAAIEPAISTVEAPAPVLSLAPAQRPNPRRTRPAGRGPERRRAALQLADNWRVPARPIVPAPLAML